MNDKVKAGGDVQYYTNALMEQASELSNIVMNLRAKLEPVLLPTGDAPIEPSAGDPPNKLVSPLAGCLRCILETNQTRLNELKEFIDRTQV